MKAAVLVVEFGVPISLAQTSFVRTLSEGLNDVGVQSRVFSLATRATQFEPGALDANNVRTPWLRPKQPHARDWLDGWRAGAFSDVDCAEYDVRSGGRGWFNELTLERDLQEHIGTDEGVLFVYPRSETIVALAARIARRKGWKVVVLSTESLRVAQTDDDVRCGYTARVIACASGIWALSSHLAEYWVENGLVPERVFVSPTLVSRRNWKPRECEVNPSQAVYIGNLAHAEIDHLFEIAPIVGGVIEGFSLHIYGDAPAARFQELTARLARLGISDMVFLHPSVPATELPETLARAGVLLMPRAAGEFSAAGFPNKVGEYLASGRPAVLTAVGQIADYLEDGTHAILVPPDDNRVFAQAVIRILSDRDLGDRIGAAGRDRAESLFRADRVAEQVAGFCVQLPVVSFVPRRGAVAAGRVVRAALSREILRGRLGALLRRLGLRGTPS